MQKLDVAKKENQVETDDIVTGAKTKRLMKGDLTPYEQKKEREKMLKFYMSAVKFLQNIFPFDNMVLAAASCLHPDNRKDRITIKQIDYLAKKFKHVIAEKDVSHH